MTRPQLVTKNLFRNSRRTLLTTASVAVSMFLLVNFIAAFRYLVAPPEPEGSRRSLLVLPRTSWSVALPLSCRQRIARLSGVAMVSPFVTFDGMYGGTDAWLSGFATDPEALLKLFNHWRVPPEQREAFVREKTALIAGRKLVERFRWKLGDHVPIRNEGWHITVDVVLRAVYTAEAADEMIGIHWQYLSELWGHPDAAGAYLVIAQGDEEAAGLVKAIDEMFRHEPMETRTYTFLQFALDFLGRVGNVKRILLAISGAVLFAILLVVANSMAMSIRERTLELAVLRVLGFRARDVHGLLTAESLAISLAGTAVACLAAWGVFKLLAGYRVGGWMPIAIQLDWITLGVTLLVAILTGLISTALPARRAVRAMPAEALRFVG